MAEDVCICYGCLEKVLREGMDTYRLMDETSCLSSDVADRRYISSLVDMLNKISEEKGLNMKIDIREYCSKRP